MKIKNKKINSELIPNWVTPNINVNPPPKIAPTYGIKEMMPAKNPNKIPKLISTKYNVIL